MPETPGGYYITVIACLISLFPLMLICIFQILTYRELQRSTHNFPPNSNRIRTMRQVLRTFIVVASVFFCLTTPFCIFSLLGFWVQIIGVLSTDVISKMYRSFALLMTINSAVNPLIYGKVHKNCLLSSSISSSNELEQQNMHQMASIWLHTMKHSSLNNLTKRENKE